MSLSDEELERYARHIVLPQVGGAGQRKLQHTSVAVIGAGGIGSAVMPALAGAGVGKLTIVDSDVVELTNLHRQPLFSEVDAGKPKAQLAAEFVQQLNRFVHVVPKQERIGPENAADLLAGHDLVIDGSDNFATRLAVSDTCVDLGIPLVSAAAVQFQGQIGLFRSKPCYRCFVGDAFDADDCDTCAADGVLGAFVGTVGAFAAMSVIRLILAGHATLGDPQWGRIQLIDGLAPSMRTLRIVKDPDCRGCSAA